MLDIERTIDEIASRLKRGRDISMWQNDHRFSPIANLLTKLSSMPKNQIPVANFERVKNQVLDRISVPKDIEVTERAGFFASLPSMLKISTGVIGALLIVVSLTIGTAVAALQSVPGQTIYPLKKIVENIELRMTNDPNAKAGLQIQFANNRLEELSTVLAQNQAGEISSSDAQKIVAQTVSDLQKTTAAALSSSSTSSGSKTQVSNLTKLVDLTNKQTAVLQPLLSAASISDDGVVKIALQQALATSTETKEQAIKNMENAGLKIEDQPITATANPTPSANAVSANGKITTLTTDTISIGTSKFLVTKDTKYDNIKPADLKVDLAVQITGEVRDDKKTYALTISPVDTTTDTNSKDSSSTSSTSTDTKSDTNTNTNNNTQTPDQPNSDTPATP